jgi:hypothetical protein
MYHTSQLQKTEGRGCHSCEANLVCEWVKGIARSDWGEYICQNYTLRGKDQNGQAKARH